MQILSVSSLKGGVGKTSVTMGLASAALNAGVRTLVIDLDPHADVTTGLSVSRGSGRETGQLLREARRADIRSHVVRSGWNELVGRSPQDPSGLDVIVGSALSATFDRPDIRPKDMRRLKMLLEGLSGYDLVLVDCPPSLSGLTRIGWAASHQVLLVAEPSLFSVAGTERTMRAIRMFSNEFAPQLTQAGVIVNRARADSTEHEYRLLEMERLYSDKLMLPVLEENPHWQQIQGAAYPVHQWPGEQVGAMARSFDELLRQLVPTQIPEAGAPTQAAGQGRRGSAQSGQASSGQRGTGPGAAQVQGNPGRTGTSGRAATTRSSTNSAPRRAAQHSQRS